MTPATHQKDTAIVKPRRKLNPHQRRVLQARKRQFIQKWALLRGWACFYCGIDCSPISSVIPTVDRIVPGRLGGTYEEPNCCLACEYCNRSKADKSLADFKRWLDHVRNTK